MSLADLKISGTSRDIGLYEINSTKVTNNMVIPGITSGDDVFVLRALASYRIYTITGRFIGTESEINTFVSMLESAETNTTTSNPMQCTLKLRWTSAYKNVWISAFMYEDLKAKPGYINYTLELTEGTPLVT